MATQLTSNGIIFNDNTVQITKTVRQGRNRIINGAMEVDQRTDGAASATNAAGNQWLSVDRYVSASATAGKFTLQQNMGANTPPPSFSKYLGFKSATAYTSLLATDYFIFGQRIEGYNIADLLWGTANAKNITISFWARSSLTGMFSISITNSSGSHSYNTTYSLPVANTWNKIEITIPGCTVGVWNTDNSVGLQLFFNMGTGTSTPTSNVNVWEVGNKIGVVGAVKVVSSLNATFFITGLQLEEGSVANEFEKIPYDEELLKCQRYYQIAYANTRAYCATASVLTTPVHYCNTMRTSPTVVLTAGTRSANLITVTIAANATMAAHRLQTNDVTAGDTYALSEKCIFIAEL